MMNTTSLAGDARNVSHIHHSPVRRAPEWGKETPLKMDYVWEKQPRETDRWSQLGGLQLGAEAEGDCSENDFGLGSEIVFMDSHVNTCLCVCVWVHFNAELSLDVSVVFRALSGHTCISFFAWLGCQGLDALSLFPLYPQEVRSWHTYTHTHVTQTAGLGVIPSSAEFKVQQNNETQLGAYREDLGLLLLG